MKRSWSSFFFDIWLRSKEEEAAEAKVVSCRGAEEIGDEEEEGWLLPGASTKPDLSDRTAGVAVDEREVRRDV